MKERFGEKIKPSEPSEDDDLVDGNALVKKYWESVKHLSPLEQLARAIEIEEETKSQKGRL